MCRDIGDILRSSEVLRSSRLKWFYSVLKFRDKFFRHSSLIFPGTLVSEMGGSSVIGLSSMSLSRMGGSGGGGSQHSPASDTTPPNSSGYNKMNSQQHFAFNNAASES